LSKLTTSQKQQLKDLVIEATVRRLTNLEMVSYIQNKMHVTISEDYLRHVKYSIKKDTKQTFTNLRKDIDLYINSLFFDRIDELRYMQRVLHEVIETNADDGEIQIKAVAQLQTITNQLNQYFIQLPDVAKVGTTIDVNTLFPSPDSANNNTPPLNLITNNNTATDRKNIPGIGNVDEYIKWCSEHNGSKHPNNCNCATYLGGEWCSTCQTRHINFNDCPEYQV
jgi:hypothetical protein